MPRFHSLSRILVAAAFAARPFAVAGGGVLEGIYTLPDVIDGGDDSAYSFLRFDSVAALDGDQKIILARLVSESDEGMLAAQRVFEKGAYSEPFAVFSHPIITGSDIPPGTVVTGPSVGGGLIRGVAHYGSPAGNGTLTVHYPTRGTDDDAEIDVATGTLDNLGGGGAMCRVGGNPSPVTDGCYAASGTLQIYTGSTASGTALNVEYTYDPQTDNSNGLSLSYLYGDRSQPGITFQKYVDYYGRVDYDSEWIRSAFAGVATPAFSNSLGGHTGMDFSRLDKEGRHAAIRWGMVVLKVWIFVVESLEEAASLCETSNADAVRRWDRAVGAFAGSGPIAETPANEADGYFVYSLIETECISFGTCGNEGGMVPLNREILQVMDSGRKLLYTGSCGSVREKAQRLVELLLVPLIQGTLRNAYALDNQDNSNGWVQGQTAAYAAAIAPHLHSCSAGDAFVVIDDLAAGNATGASFEVIKDSLERSYGCLRVTCEDIDGLRAVNSDAYEPGAEPCGTVGSLYTDPSVPAPTPALPSIPEPATTTTTTSTNSGSSYSGYSDLSKTDDIMIGVTIGASLVAAAIAIGYCCWDAKQTKGIEAAKAAEAEADRASSGEVDSDAVEPVATNTQIV
eukprot:CAMPEP_0197179574 /NCGR_PEP_ID=MMETSP1423-20130617/4473_1 /TAXON_ID=476441 /ORGANISM="Pseudo-nitzschia heimii, Strain UNC1101" /LENGTH=624 /DNA_ID=CAMNT_0042629497 /DNA_START=259 /DNA_END=2133 /DNA_ORIENTATION=-